MKPYPPKSLIAASLPVTTVTLTRSLPRSLPLNTELQLFQSPVSTHSHSHLQSRTDVLTLHARTSVLTPHARKVAVTVALWSSWVLATAAAPSSRRHRWSRSWALGSCPLALWVCSSVLSFSGSARLSSSPLLLTSSVLVVGSSPLSYQISKNMNSETVSNLVTVGADSEAAPVEVCEPSLKKARPATSDV
ncbi:uncharacterized protein LOC110272144 [Arachis ipaensis]|uniref:uncharacterized protein LOC110272144 n=1 Tax=Arachis ipaensis TaxID=130454 RepID=UPI000A2B07D6|nr:uncharacterized protein LOC110272144 [Arachis ipaensis]